MSISEGSLVAEDVTDALTGDALGHVRNARPVVRRELAAADAALFSPHHGDFSFPVAERLVIALYTAALHQDPRAISFYGGRAQAAGVARDLEESALALAEEHIGEGPFGAYRVGGPLAAESVDGRAARVPRESVFGVRLGAALEHAHRVLLHPRDTSHADLERLSDAGWTSDQIVILTQLVAVLALQLRIAAGVRALEGAHDASSSERVRLNRRAPRRLPPPEAPVSGDTPERFTEHVVAWSPWLTGGADRSDDDFDWAGTFGKRRASSPSFRLSARDPRISLPLSRIEDDVFGESADGLPRAERELAALVVSRENGCLYCASVHSRTAIKFGGRREPVIDILDDGTAVQLDDRWSVLADAAVALTRTPIGFAPADAAALLELGLDEVAVLDFVHSVGYFNFANRIMLTLGQPVFP